MLPHTWLIDDYWHHILHSAALIVKSGTVTQSGHSKSSSKLASFSISCPFSERKEVHRGLAAPQWWTKPETLTSLIFEASHTPAERSIVLQFYVSVGFLSWNLILKDSFLLCLHSPLHWKCLVPFGEAWGFFRYHVSPQQHRERSSLWPATCNSVQKMLQIHVKTWKHELHKLASFCVLPTVTLLLWLHLSLSVFLAEVD